jgi:hypothetical protein
MKGSTGRTHLLLAALLFFLPLTADRPVTNSVRSFPEELRPLLGVWRLDLKASEPLDGILSLMGMGTFEALLLRLVPMTHHISPLEGGILVETETPVRSQQATYLLGVPGKSINHAKDEVETHSSLDSSGALLTTSHTVTKKGSPAVVTLRRFLSADSNTMYFLMTYSTGGKSASALRVFRKIN